MGLLPDARQVGPSRLGVAGVPFVDEGGRRASPAAPAWQDIQPVRNHRDDHPESAWRLQGP